MILRHGMLCALSIALLGCGADDDDPSSSSLDLPTSGFISEPELTRVDAADGMSVSLNSLISGSLEEGESLTFSYTMGEAEPLTDDAGEQILDEFGMVVYQTITPLFVLTGGENNFDLMVGDLSSTNKKSFEYIALLEGFSVEEVSGEYSITVTATEGAGEFSLKVVPLNHESLGASEGDNLILARVEGPLHCESGSRLLSFVDLFLINTEAMTGMFEGAQVILNNFDYHESNEIQVSYAVSSEEITSGIILGPKYEYELFVEDGLFLTGYVSSSTIDSETGERCISDMRFESYAIF